MRLSNKGIGGAVLIRYSLRTARANGRVLSPMMNMIAGQPRAPKLGDLKGPWAIGGFQARMDRKEAKDILGLKFRLFGQGF